MPTYEYRCQKCSHEFSTRESFEQHDRPHKVKCPECGSQRTRRILGEIFVKTSKKS